ncbi:MAG TPA: copper-containing nitrite reductase [Candidatus Acidoferrum sp.]|nr:copper-containing nitrite reductase [Candidatus Acidoferrum sp.]
MKSCFKRVARLGMACLPVWLFPSSAMFAGEPSLLKATTGQAEISAAPSSENAVLTQAPAVPPPIARRQPAKVVVNLEVKEVVRRLADGVEYPFWTFGGEVPGKFIRIREGDEVEFHLHNDPNNKMPHNIDLHAVTGPGGGAVSSFTAPGHSSQFSFQALNPGLFVYHCATAPVGMHVANGMYGLILVEPKEGLPPVDHEYYVMQGEFYTPGKFGDEGLRSFDLDKAIDEKPTYVVFNGAVGALNGEHPLTARVGERIRLYVGNGGPNLTSSFHLIGVIFDTVYPEGGTTPMHNVQTTVIPPGGAAVVEFTAKVPGSYTFVDHALFRAFNRGANGTLTVSGPENPVVYSGKQADTLYAGDGTPPASPVAISRVHGASGAEFTAAPANAAPPSVPASERAQFERGRQVYGQTCFICHQPDGKGVPGQIPPLARSDLLMADKAGAIRGVLQGRNGEVTVNGKHYNGTMIPFSQQLTDQQIADVITYVRNSWGNSGEGATPQEVQKIRQTMSALAGKPAPNPYE